MSEADDFVLEQAGYERCLACGRGWFPSDAAPDAACPGCDATRSEALAAAMGRASFREEMAALREKVPGLITDEIVEEHAARITARSIRERAARDARAAELRALGKVECPECGVILDTEEQLSQWCPECGANLPDDDEEED